MEFKYGDFVIDIFFDQTYTIKSVDNKYIYNFEYVSNNYLNNLPSKYGILVKNCDNEIINSAIVMSGGGGTTLPDTNTIKIEEENLIFVIGNSVYSLSIPNLELNWSIECENTVVCIGIYKFKNDYIIHGELSILKINKLGKIEWEFFGRDIFTTIDGTNVFNIENDLILVRDWGNYIYILNSRGEQVNGSVHHP